MIHDDAAPGRTPLYNFRLAPEAIWLIVNTLLGTALVELAAQFLQWEGAGGFYGWEAWGTGFLFGLGRTLLGAILAAATGGQFLGPRQRPANPTSG